MTDPITPDLVYHLKTTSDPNLSPDGSLLAYTLGWVDAETVSNRSQIIVLDLDNGSKKELTQGAKDSAPKISSDGLRTAFLRSVDGSPPQVWIIGMEGNEPKKVTDLPKGVIDYGWSPDGKSLAVCGDVDPEEADAPVGTEGVPQVTVVQRVRYR